MTNEQRIKQEAQQSRDSIELHLRRDCERLAEGLKVEVAYFGGKYHLSYQGVNLHLFSTREGYDGPFTLQELHQKLTELTEGK